MTPSSEALTSLLRRFGHDEFRPGQRRVIDNLLQGRDVLAVLPTGSGKSLTYQLVAQLLPGATVVVSPLIALMQDQIESLEAVAMPAELVNSTRSASEQHVALERLRRGDAKLLYVTPERFENAAFMRAMARVPVSLLAVDEAHSISEWGHDFRPAYLNLGAAAAQLGHPPILALTATATPWVRGEIIERLGLRDPVLVVHGTDRPNLFFEVLRVEREGEDRDILRRMFGEVAQDYPKPCRAELVEAMQGSGIIYTRTTAAAEETAAWLNQWGIASDYYHGQRCNGERAEVQDRFMRGELRVICATNAFGLGVDKPDVRFVVHRDVPASVESYYQESGRAGRDGGFARCTLIYRPGDLSRAAFLAAGSHITEEKVRALRDALRGHRGIGLPRLERESGLNDRVLGDLVAALEHAGVLRERNGRIALARADIDVAGVTEQIEQRRESYEQSRVEMMRRYAELADCRRVYLLNYFGEEPGFERCDRCDNELLQGADAWIQVREEEAVAVPFTLGDRVIHPEWGAGVVQRVEEDALTVLFDEAGFKSLSSQLVLENYLLRLADWTA
ncbi:MAG TPA: RecQ family ATP-dependent DNA helicase [Nitrolancea sp.]|nr:RecQ family ATP-dependent DNA helicase [Nitrolancea sp.]